MICLNDYLYNGDTVLKILHKYEADLRNHSGKDILAIAMDELHADYLNGIVQILEHNDFLTSQSQRIREFYSYMVEHYPYLSFTFKGRIKSLIRAEEKFNRHLIEVTDKAPDKGHFMDELAEDAAKKKITDIRDIIAYRIIISVPQCHLKEGENITEKEISALYNIANELPDFMMKHQFKPEIMEYAKKHPSSKICEKWRFYYKDFIQNKRESGYKSLHIVFYDEISKCRFEMQLRTKDMDDFAEIGEANHTLYEQNQKKSWADKNDDNKEMSFYVEAYERLRRLQELDLSKVKVNMFAARNNILMNDGCGLYRGRLILPYEHLSRFQNDQIG